VFGINLEVKIQVLSDAFWILEVKSGLRLMETTLELIDIVVGLLEMHLKLTEMKVRL